MDTTRDILECGVYFRSIDGTHNWSLRAHPFRPYSILSSLLKMESTGALIQSELRKSQQ